MLHLSSFVAIETHFDGGLLCPVALHKVSLGVTIALMRWDMCH